MTRFDALCEQVAATLDVDDVIMDGEVIAADETGRPSSTISYGARESPPTLLSIFSGPTVSICAPYL